jgi:hypothetical protein
MATLTGADGVVTFANVAVGSVRNFSVEVTADTIETSVMGNDTRTYVKGMSSYSGSADIYFDPVEFNGNAHFNIGSSSAQVGASPIAAKFYLVNDSTDTVLFANSVVLTGYTVNSSMDGMIEASISFQGSGALGFSSGTNVPFATS